MDNKSILETPAGIYIKEIENDAKVFTAAGFLRLDNEIEEINNIRIKKLKKWRSLARKGLYWNRTFTGEKLAKVPEETQFFLWQREDNLFGLMLPLLYKNHRAFLSGNNDFLTIKFSETSSEEEITNGNICFFAACKDPFTLIKQSFKVISQNNKNFKLRKEKSIPDFIDYFGWCTWDAFYHNVDQTKVLAGLDSFQEGGVEPGFMILDDGWLNKSGDLMNAFTPDDNSFPGGLIPLIDKAKNNYNLKYFGLWHTFQGYWAGINPESELEKKYKTIATEGVIRPWKGDVQSLNYVHPEDVYSFYFDFYRFLYNLGVDLVKVDGQSALEVFAEGNQGRVSAMESYQEAMQGAAGLYFDFSLIHCMCNSSDVAYNMLGTNVWRNSDDYFPKESKDVQQGHVYKNIFNNLWSSNFSIPDWDMFQTHGQAPEFHAAARAISGGPVYVSDHPGKQNFDILKKLVLKEGKVPRFDRPALPAKDSLFIDFPNQKRLLKCTNIKGDIGIIGLFHCYQEDEAVQDNFTPTDILGITGDEFAVYYHQKKKIAVMEKDEQENITLDNTDFELITISPVIDNCAILGYLDKYAGPAAVNKIVRDDKNDRIRLKMEPGGEIIGFYCAREVEKILLNGKQIEYTIEDDNLYKVSAKKDLDRIEVDIVFV